VKDATEYYEGKLKKEPKWERGWVDYAAMSMIVGDDNRAIEIYERGVKALPDSERLHYTLACRYGDIDQYKKMRAELNEVLRINPQNSMAARTIKTLDKKGL